jgi:hypothetical protein
MSVVVHRDTDYLATGTHKGLSAVYDILDRGRDFMSCGVAEGLSVINDTKSISGKVVSSTEDTVTTNILWDKGDTYRIFKTTTYNSLISKHYTDKRYGDKVTHQRELINGLKPRDIDDDEFTNKVFSQGQPWRD